MGRKTHKSSIAVALKKLNLENPDLFWEALMETELIPPKIQDKPVFIRSDDCDGEAKGIEVAFQFDSDASIDFTSIDNFKSYGLFHAHRFRVPSGGSMSPMIQKALRLLAFAVNKSERPISDAMRAEIEELKKSIPPK